MHVVAGTVLSLVVLLKVKNSTCALLFVTLLSLTLFTHRILSWFIAVPRVRCSQLAPASAFIPEHNLSIMAIKSIDDVRDVVYRKPPKYLPLSSNDLIQYHPSPLTWDDQLFYFLLPDRFSDGSETLDKLYNSSYNGVAIDTDQHAQAWRDAGKNWVHGNLQGLRSKLGYLKELGITTLWIGPIFKQVKWSDTYHGYGIQNFFEVDPRFGTKDDLKALIEAAHSREYQMYVVLDIILNHSGDVFEYKYHNPDYTGETFDVKGFYAAQNNASLRLGPVDDSHYPDGAVWPKELQNADCFTRKGRIKSGGWDKKPEYWDGDFYALKDIVLGPDEPYAFNAPSALRTLCEVYKYWIAETDIDGYRIDTVKHMGDGPARYFCSVIHEYAQLLGKDKFLLIGEVASDEADADKKAYITVERTGLDAALGIGNVQAKLWNLPSGNVNPEEYFNLFRNALYLDKGSHKWLGEKLVTMIDDHDQIWRGKEIGKARFCSVSGNNKLVAAALMLNLCTLGIPCIYYGTEQAFDGSGFDGDEGFADRYIREAMFGGNFGAFRSKGVHFFDQDKDVYQAVREVAKIRKREIALRRGRQYLREISGDGMHFGLTRKMDDKSRIKGIVAWSRVFANVEVLCAINTDPDDGHEAWINVDKEVHPRDTTMRYLTQSPGGNVTVDPKGDRSAVYLKLGAGQFAILK